MTTAGRTLLSLTLAFIAAASISCEDEEPDRASFELTCEDYHIALTRCTAEGVTESMGDCVDELRWRKRTLSKECAVTTSRLFYCFAELDCEELRDEDVSFQACDSEVEDIERVCK